LSTRTRIRAFLGILSLFFMSYSGYIKWIPGLPIDPFVFFIILLILVTFFSGFRNTFKKESLSIGIILFSFFIWSFLSTTWGSSSSYYFEKIQKSVVILFCFFTPFFVLRTRERIDKFISLFHFITFLTALSIFIIFIIYGDLFLVLYLSTPGEESAFPDYLALGILLASGFILALHKEGRFWLFYKTIIFIAIVLLAPRGPLLTLIFFTALYYLANVKFQFKSYMAVYMVIVGIFFLNFSDGITARLFSRFQDISDSDSSAYSSVGSRFELANAAFDFFLKSPFIGVGYGSFGTKVYGVEDRIEPHNIFFEIAAEVGIIGILLFVTFLVSIYFYAFRKKEKNDPTASALHILTLYLFVQSLSTTYLIDSKALFLWLSVFICYLSKNTALHDVKTA
jgi:O-antigen ligase